MTSISVLTPTNGKRPELLELCRRYVRRQTVVGKVELVHVVASGGSLLDNLREGLPRCNGDLIAIFEDDDHYAPDWLEVASIALGSCVAVGEGVARYYHVPTGGHWVEDLHPAGRASFCATAFRRELIPLLLERLDGSPFVDVRFWAKIREQHPGDWILLGGPDRPPFVVGIKGLRPGLGRGHDPTFYRQREEPAGAVLEDWIGADDVAAYRELLGGPVRDRDEG